MKVKVLFMLLLVMFANNCFAINKLANFDLNNPIQKELAKCVLSDKKQLSFKYDNLSDEEVAKIVRLNYNIYYNGMFGVYVITCNDNK